MSAPAGAVLVVGDVMTDIIVRPDGPLAPGSDRRAAIRLRPGGAGANLAAWLGLLGVQVRLAARVGAADRDRCAAWLGGFGVTPLLAADHERPTGMLVSLIGQDGERSFLTDRGANAALGRRDLPASLLDGAALLHVSGYALFEAGPRAAVLALIAAARRRGIPVSVDAASAVPLAASGAAAFRTWTEGATLCAANAAEAAVLAGSDDPAVQLAELAACYGLAVVKRGAAGAALARRDGLHVALPVRPAAARDSTGAGDAFLAGFLAAWLAGAPPERCLARGIALGAGAVTRLGGQPRQGGRRPLLSKTHDDPDGRRHRNQRQEPTMSCHRLLPC
jgi:sugar/nucleoside kinase (ribokinase family)